MSLIIREWKCEKCKEIIQQYVSFGYPFEDFDYSWKCWKCGHINVSHIKGFLF